MFALLRKRYHRDVEEAVEATEERAVVVPDEVDAVDAIDAVDDTATPDETATAGARICF